MRLKHCILMLTWMTVFLSSCNMKSKQKVDAVAVLQNNMQTQSAWVKVHAAEFLLWSGHPEGVKETFLAENRLYSDSTPYRIGIWRILAQAETEPQQKEVWINKIKTAFLDENGKDRPHAIETLAKLKVPAFGKEVHLNDILTSNEMDNFAVYKLWNFAYSSEENFSIAQDSLLKLSISSLQNPAVRAISGYALKKMGNLNHASWNLLAESALSDSTDIQANLLNAAIVTANQEIIQTDLYKQVKQALIALNNREDKNSIKMSLLDALAEKGNPNDLNIIYSIFDKIKSSEDAESADVLSSCAYAILLSSLATEQSYSLADLYIRDPYILPDAKSGYYYLYCTSTSSNAETGGVEVFKSKDLKQWQGPVQVFSVPENNWITGMVWAPEVHFYKGKYYLFATLNSDLTWKKRKKDWPAYTFRGTQIFHSDNPEGPFLPFDLVPHTPMDYMALDGTLWEENGKPYLIFCHEWVQIVDGTMELQELKPDLSAPAGPPMRLFCASDAPWTPAEQERYITDGCFLYRTKTGKLLMIWSSFAQNGYAIGIAESVSGKITGPWKQHPEPLLNKNGGHGMIFHTFDGKLCLVLHQPNNPAGAERAHIFELEDTGDTLLIKTDT